MNRAKDKASWQADNSRLILATMKQRQERTKEEEEEEKRKKRKKKIDDNYSMWTSCWLPPENWPRIGAPRWHHDSRQAIVILAETACKPKSPVSLDLAANRAGVHDCMQANAARCNSMCTGRWGVTLAGQIAVDPKPISFLWRSFPIPL